MDSFTRLVAAVLLGAGFSGATVLQIPYTSGKQMQAVEVSMRAGDLATGTYRPSPDSIRVGTVFTIRFGVASHALPTVCGAKPTFIVQFLFNGAVQGAVRQRADTSAAWNQFAAYPADSLINLDSITGWNASSMTDSIRSPGFHLMDAGQRNSCSGSEFSFKPRWNRLVFFRRFTSGTGIDHFTKVAITGYNDTTFGFFPVYNVLRSITVNYVINATSGDISGPVAIRPARPSRGSLQDARFGAGVEYDLYNPLGVRLRREAGRFEPAVPGAARR